MDTSTIVLPSDDGKLESYSLVGSSVTEERNRERGWPARRVYSAAHVVTDPLKPWSPGDSAPIDWDSTLAYRDYLLSLGLGVAEAMDTAQRGQGIDAPAAMRLVEETAALVRARGSGHVCAGCTTDDIPAGARVSLDDIVAAYRGQLSRVAHAGATPVIMASRHLALVANGARDYVNVYSQLLSVIETPVILHWLGAAFDPMLAEYWGATDPVVAMENCLEIVERYSDRIDGIKISLLDKELEISMRRRLPRGVRMYTGDDFNYPELIAGDAEGYSDALLGVFDAIAPVAAKALGRLNARDEIGFRTMLDPTIPLARHIFEAPTQYYKTGVVFLAYLNGHQDHFVMVGGMQGMRSVQHFARLFRLADQACALRDPELATKRMRRFLHVAGVEG